MFLSGKYEIFQRGIPFLAVRQAIETLVEQVSTPSATTIEKGRNSSNNNLRQLQREWEHTFRQYLDPSCCELMVDFIPSLQKILSPSHPSTSSSSSSSEFSSSVPQSVMSTESEARFKAVVTKFLHAITSRGPLALFVSSSHFTLRISPASNFPSSSSFLSFF
jgi:predicted ATPase